MTTTLPETTTEIGLEILEALEFEPDCEHPNHGVTAWHEGPGALYVGYRKPCPSCGFHPSGTSLLCASAWAYWGTDGVRCDRCDKTYKRDELVKVFGTVK